MQTFVIRRERAWEAPEQLEEAAQRSKDVAADEFPDEIGWIRSYVIAEPDGTRRSPRSYSPPPLRPPPRGSGSQARRRPGSSRRGSADVDLTESPGVSRTLAMATAC